VMRAAGEDPDGVRLRALIVVLWRAGLRISEALALAESDLDPSRGAVLVRRGKGGKRGEVGMDRWAWEQLARGWSSGQACLQARCSACSEARHAVDPAQPRRSEFSFAAPLSARASGDGSPHISYAMRTPSRCHAKVCRSSSSSASSATPISRSPRCTCAESTTPKSSTLSTNGPHPRSPPATASEPATKSTDRTNRWDKDERLHTVTRSRREASVGVSRSAGRRKRKLRVPRRARRGPSVLQMPVQL
jgi:hypothetical protein